MVREARAEAPSVRGWFVEAGDSYFAGVLGPAMYDLSVHPRPLAIALVDALLPHGNASGRILDVATGTGRVAIELARRLPDASIIGLDIDVDGLTLARQLAGQACCPATPS